MSVGDILSSLMFVAFIALIFTGFPVAWVLGGLAVLFTADLYVYWCIGVQSIGDHASSRTMEFNVH